jgi:dihydrofolate synthase / folylpolyglutamate synthase
VTGPDRLTYSDAVRALTERGRFGINLGLDRVERVMAAAGNPERGLRGALVGGTNGKGSVVAMAQAVLTAAGYRVGTMPKPHLVSYRERIAVDGEPIAASDFADAVARVLPAIDAVVTDAGPPTEFEALTAAAVAELARRRVDLAIVEVGMGGRLDATNVLDLGAAAITNVQLDHQQYLGRTLEAIGREKAAIIKPGNVAVTGATGNGLRPIVERASAVGGTLLLTGPGRPYRTMVRRFGWDGLVLDAATPGGRISGLHIGLLGRHQARNAATVLALLDALRARGEIHVPEDRLRDGLATARWPGRLELLHAETLGRRVLLDGAHNPAGARSLAATLAELGVERPSIVFGAMRSKDVRGVLAQLAPLGPRFVFTRVDDPGAHDPDALAATWSALGGSPARVAEDAGAALALADGDPIVVAGSLYLVGAVRGMIVPMETTV